MTVGPFVKDPNSRVWKCLSTFFASQLVRLDVVFVLVLLGKQKLVKLELLSAMLANGYLEKERFKIAFSY